MYFVKATLCELVPLEDSLSGEGIREVQIRVFSDSSLLDHSQDEPWIVVER